jgi:hypothetical protein
MNLFISDGFSKFFENLICDSPQRYSLQINQSDELEPPEDLHKLDSRETIGIFVRDLELIVIPFVVQGLSN